MKELKRFQTIRRIEWQNAAQRQNKSIYKDPFLAEAATRFSSGEQHNDLKKQSQRRHSAGSSKSEYLNPKQVEKEAILKKQSQSGRSAFGVPRSELDDLKKQSQFAMDDIAASLFEQEGYGGIPAGIAEENKANRTQSQTDRRLIRPSGVAQSLP
jgi:hypothetical protein